jgi:uncharacterized protein YkwD
MPKAGLALIFSLAACSAAAQPDAGEVAYAVNAVRTQGCGRRPGVAPLRRDPRLDVAAREIAVGRELKEALAAGGYRASQVATLEATGSVGAIERNLAERGCKDVMNAVYLDLGVAETGSTAWILLATPLDAPAAADADSVSRQVLALVNEARSQKRRCGWKRYDAAPPLALAEPLQRAATAHAADMAAKGVMSHSGSDGTTAAQRAERAGYHWRFVGENVATGQSTPEQVVEEWLGSPHHCANLMSADFTEMGVAYAASASGVYWAQVFGAPGR